MRFRRERRGITGKWWGRVSRPVQKAASNLAGLETRRHQESSGQRRSEAPSHFFASLPFRLGLATLLLGCAGVTLAATEPAAAPRPLADVLGSRTGRILVSDPVSGRLLDSVRIPPGLERSEPIGSLVKVILQLVAATEDRGALAALATCGATRAGARPEEGCWLRRGHGNVGFAMGLAHSCGRHATMLARRVDRAIFRERLQQLGVDVRVPEPSPPDRWLAAATGHGTDLRATPRAMLAALASAVNGGYLYSGGAAGNALVRRIEWPVEVVAAVHEGMRLAASEGTARGARVPGALAKTGTAIALDAAGRTDPSATQGWAFLYRPPGSTAGNGLAVLVHLDRGTGADAARVAGQAIRRWRPESPAR